MNPEWYYTADGAQHGPVTAADLKKLARAGTIQPEDLIWKNGTPNWVAAKSVKGLFGSTESKTEAAKTESASANAEDSATELVEDLTAKKKTDNRLADRLSEIQKKPIKEQVSDDEDDEEEKPRPKRASRARDEDDDDEDDRPRKRKSRRDDDDDDDDYRPSRSRRRDDDDEDDFDDRPQSRKRRRRSGQKPGTGLGMGSMICGILGLVVSGSSCFLGAFCALGFFGYAISGILALVAVCLGFPALKTEGKGFGIAGLVTGFLGLIPVLLGIIGIIFGAAFLGVNAMAR